jgi:diaminopimelate epimerase
MNFPFVKYHGTGNDFILIDDRRSHYEIDAGTIRKMCDRHFGIGGDGLIQLRNNVEFDFEMLYYNSDGLPGSMCGNGGRCAMAYAHSLGIIKEYARFKAFDGIHEAKIISKNPFVVSLHMNDVTNIEINPGFIFMDTGSPHYISFINNVEKADVINEGKKVRFSDRFKKEGTNVNFVEEKDSGIYVRTYERGVEDETLSCGTGVTASVLAAAVSGKIISSGMKCKVITPGGNLMVYFKRDGNNFTDIWLEGEAQPVFTGEINYL